MNDTDHAGVPPARANLGPQAGAYVPVEEIAGISRYARSTLHASGGMGAVWRAWDVTLCRDVALKELREDGEAAAARFVREARITGQLDHPGVVPVYELGRDPQTGRPYYVMRFIRGRTLTEVAQDFHAARRPGWYEPMELVRLLSAFVSVCNTIGYAHSKGIIHRDLKGDNIILGEFGEVIVLDWGVARRLDGPDDEPSDADVASSVARTRAGQLVGTVSYMSPEQAGGRLDRVGTHTDVFGLGAILYEVLTGRPPYEGETFEGVLFKAAAGAVVPPRERWPEVPAGLEAACLRALSPEPTDRHASAVELGREVQGWQDRQRRHAEDELRQAFERMHRQQAALVSLTRTDVFPGPNLNTTFHRLVEASAKTLGVERVSIWRLSPDRRSLRCHVLYELSSGRYSAGAELRADAYPNYFAALAATDVIAADDARTDPRTREFTDGYLVPLSIGAMMEVPVPPDGVLCHEHVGPPRRWLPDEQLFGIAVGHLAAHALSHWEGRQ